MSLRSLIAWLGEWFWPFKTGKYRDRECFRLRRPEEERPRDLLVTQLAVKPIEPPLRRRTVRATQPPSKRSLNGGRRK